MGGKVVEMDWLNRFDAAVAQGEKRREKRGEKRGKENMIRRMLENGKSAEEIADFVGVPQKEIEKVLKKMPVTV